VWLWDEWPDRDGPDTGIDLVAEEREGGLCAIQCKFFDPHRPVPKKAIDSFLARSEPMQYTSRLIINTGGAIQRNALKVLQASPKPCRVLDASELNGWNVDWLRHLSCCGSKACAVRRSSGMPKANCSRPVVSGAGSAGARDGCSDDGGNTAFAARIRRGSFGKCGRFPGAAADEFVHAHDAAAGSVPVRQWDSDSLRGVSASRLFRSVDRLACLYSRRAPCGPSFRKARPTAMTLCFACRCSRP